MQHTWPRVQYLPPLRLNTPAPSVMMSAVRQRLLSTQVQLVVEVPGTTTPRYLSDRRMLEVTVSEGGHTRSYHLHPWSVILLHLLLPIETES